jgi:two-component system response regulator FixJ
MVSAEPCVYIVDDDVAVRESLAALLSSYGFETVEFDSAIDFLDRADRDAAGCLIADIRMPEMDGLTLQERVTSAFQGLAVVIITGHGDVPLAVRAMKAGAVDFVEKPFVEDVIVGAVRRALAKAGGTQRQAAEQAELQALLGQLTPREREVLEGLVAGLPNKTIGYDLGISPRTVEVHRARVMEKLHVKSLSELVRLALAAGVRAP